MVYISRPIFRLRDSKTGAFWNGNYYHPDFIFPGKYWSTKSGLENSLTYMFAQYQRIKPQKPIPTTWEIVEMKLTEEVIKVEDINDFLFHKLVKTELVKLHWKYEHFYDVMTKRGYINKIEFIVSLTPSEDRKFVNSERIMECRAQLRLLGIKTRTFREYSGIFGMLNREQAMAARLTMDLGEFIDLGEIREKIKQTMI